MDEGKLFSLLHRTAAPPHTASHVCNYFKTFLYEKPSEKHKQSKQKNQHSSNQFKENNIYDINSSAV